MTNFDTSRFHREAIGVRGFDNVSNYTIDNKCFWRVITYEDVTLYQICTTYTRKLYSSLFYNWNNLLLLED